MDTKEIKKEIEEQIFLIRLKIWAPQYYTDVLYKYINSIGYKGKKTFNKGFGSRWTEFIINNTELNFFTTDTSSDINWKTIVTLIQNKSTRVGQNGDIYSVIFILSKFLEEMGIIDHYTLLVLNEEDNKINGIWKGNFSSKKLQRNKKLNELLK